MIPIPADFECVSHGHFPEHKNVRVVALKSDGQLIECHLHVAQYEDLSSRSLM
jgi:hypothetical protein